MGFPSPPLSPQRIYRHSMCIYCKHMVNNSLMSMGFKSKELNNHQFPGGCQCGALRYGFNGPLGTTDLCHCRMCQKAFGSFGAVLLRVSLERFSWTRGKPSTFKSSPIVERGFCKNCGTPMFMFEAGDAFVDLAVGTMDNPNAIQTLQSQIGMESRVHWFSTLHNLPEATTGQTRQPDELAKLQTWQHPDYDTEVWPPKPPKK